MIERGRNIRSQKFVVSPGMVLFGKINPRVPKIWQVVSRTPKRRIASTEFIPLAPVEKKITSDFLFYLCWSLHILAKSQEMVSGSTPSRQRIDVKAFLKIPIPLPPFSEQRAIAYVLRTVQRAKETTEGVIAALRELKKSLMQHLFTYGPVPVDKADQIPLQETEIGPLPKHWRVVRLGELFEIQQGKALSRKRNQGRRPRYFLRTANVLWGKIDLTKLDTMDFSQDEEKKYELRKGDLLVCEGGEIGRTAMWEGELRNVYYQNHLHRLRRKTSDVEPAFYMYWMQTALTLFRIYEGIGNKTTIPNLSRSRLSAFLIPLPPLDEQQEVARILQTVDRKIEAEKRRKEALDALFKTLLHLLMTGKIRTKGLSFGEEVRHAGSEEESPKAG